MGKTLTEIAQQLKDTNKKVQLIYALEHWAKNPPFGGFFVFCLKGQAGSSWIVIVTAESLSVSRFGVLTQYNSPSTTLQWCVSGVMPSGICSVQLGANTSLSSSMRNALVSPVSGSMK